jgi:molybdopterin/thiamine biosynthesis adenylyltransferase
MRSDQERYARQLILPQIGNAGQAKLAGSRVVVAGCGALGTNIANLLARAGVGTLRIVDRDIVELNNLQRQVLFDEEDANSCLPKAVAAANKLAAVNSQIALEPVVADISPRNVESVIAGADLVVDGTDNFETRFLINDACVKLGVPWVYGAVIGTEGMCMTIVPRRTPCFRCFVPEMPPPGSSPTCDTAGVLNTAAAVVAALEVTAAFKVLTGQFDPNEGRLLCIDLWSGELTAVEITKPELPCPACDGGRFEFLESRQGSWAYSLCGRQAVQINLRGNLRLSLPELAERLRSVGSVECNEHMLRLQVDSYELYVFPNGRTIVKGCSDPARGRAVFARYVGL